MRLFLIFLIILCIGCVSVATAYASLPYSVSPATLSYVPFSDESSQRQDTPGVIAAGLIVISTPPGGEVFVDGELLGTTPCTLPGLSQGIHIVTIRTEGYMGWTRPILIRDRHTVNLNAELIPGQAKPVPTHTPKPTLTHPSITPVGTPIPASLLKVILTPAV